MSTFKLFETDMKVPCDTFQCHERAAYFIGKEDAPKSMLTKVCEKCATELAESILKKYENVTTVEALPFEEVEEGFGIEVDGKLIADMNVAELKKVCKKLGITGYSDKTRTELLLAIEEATNDIALEEVVE